MECAQTLASTKKYWLRFIQVKAQTVSTEPDAESVQAGFKTSNGVTGVIPLEANINLGVISVLLVSQAKIWNNLTDGEIIIIMWTAASQQY